MSQGPREPVDQREKLNIGIDTGLLETAHRIAEEHGPNGTLPPERTKVIVGGLGATTRKLTANAAYAASVLRMIGAAPGTIAGRQAAIQHAKTHCSHCDQPIPPGRPGRKCKDCRLSGANRVVELPIHPVQENAA